MSLLDEIAKIKQQLCNVLDIKDTHFANENLTANANRTHNWAGFDLSIERIRNLKFISDNGNNPGELKFSHTGKTTDKRDNFLLINYDGLTLNYKNITTGKNSYFKFGNEGLVELNSSNGNYFIKNLNLNLGQDKLIGVKLSDGSLGYITIGANLTLLNGVLSAAGSSGGSSTGANMANTNLVATADRIHNWAGYNLLINAIKAYGISSSEDASISSDKNAYLQGKLKAILYSNGKGLIVNSNGDLQLTQYLSARNDGATTKAFYTDASGNLKYGPVASSGGEVNTASNVGTGEQVFKTKSGVDLVFKTLKQGANMTITTAGDEIIFASSASGGGGGVYYGDLTF